MNWLILRGLARQKEHWGEFFDELKKSPGVYEVMAIDLPGFGENADKEVPLTVSGITDFIRAEWEEKKSKNNVPWGIMGLSLGGMVTMDWVTRFENDFNTAVVINSSSRKHSKVIDRLKFYNFFKSYAQNISLWSVEQKEKVVLATVSNIKAYDAKTLEAWVRISESQPVKPLNILRQLTAACLFSAKPEKIKIPILFLGSSKDRLVDISCTLNLAKNAPHARLRVHHAGGHELTLDDPQWVLNEMLTTAKELPSSPHDLQ